MVEDAIMGYAERSLRDELQTSTIYAGLSKRYRDRALSEKLSELANIESEHADFWIRFLRRREVDTSRFVINRFQIRFLTIMYRLLGVGLTLKILEAGEHGAIGLYSTMMRSPKLSTEEKSELKKIIENELGHEEEFEEYESRYKFFIHSVSAIFTQMSSGLVTVLSVSIGFAGAYGESVKVIIPALIVGISGALNTVVGFYFFGRMERQVKMDIMSRIKVAVESAPQVFVNRVFKYMKKDMNEETATVIADEVSRKTDLLNKIIIREEYGMGEESLGNPLETSLYTGLFRIIGTILPLSPYFLGLPVETSIPISVTITLLLLTFAGFIVALSANISVKNKILELIVGGLILTSLTFLIGKLTSVLTDTLA